MDPPQGGSKKTQSCRFKAQKGMAEKRFFRAERPVEARPAQAGSMLQIVDAGPFESLGAKNLHGGLERHIRIEREVPSHAR